MAAAKGVCLHHIARETSNVERLSNFYQQLLGFEKIESPKFGEFEVVWLRLPPVFSLHIIERNPNSKLPEGPWSSTSTEIVAANPESLSRAHHLCFAVSNYHEFVQTLKEREIKIFEKTQPDGKTKQVFFFDPDGNGLEVGSWEAPKE
ncbi:hypothetical protein GIB67_004573 [Kingdonia uniflora]|uniref:VOC domain-containing protein n=1 Tax=Kingdonia uniflora TaxID=39325 RepID=A0A7J7MKZ8_9MAGN|nr:hypothetical protein GIB67_004573 [Kingdonia uniflora]